MLQNDLDSEVFHWSRSQLHRGCMVCPSCFEDGWFGNYVDWWGDTQYLNDRQFASPEDAIAAAKQKIDEEIRQFILGNAWSAISDLHQLGVIHVPEA